MRRGGAGIILGVDLGFFKVAVGDEVFVSHLHLREAVAGVGNSKDEDSKHVHAVRKMSACVSRGGGGLDKLTLRPGR